MWGEKCARGGEGGGGGHVLSSTLYLRSRARQVDIHTVIAGRLAQQPVEHQLQHPFTPAARVAAASGCGRRAAVSTEGAAAGPHALGLQGDGDVVPGVGARGEQRR